ncbi:MAG: tRNA (adenosine(37)-N6)-threonylcarbamoyltransferase complex transferase subunit TsaD [Hyphomicrobiales bacterium]|nr:MAG: tRNA (adenosine(37)-N6)-threonylcarbamoyltransferase complex transferase subunit TsaD [Hyphomicrobiales bacterium]
MIVLGIETSCDETAAAVVRRHADGRGEILSNVVLSQIEEHAAFGGVVPEIAARAHIEALDGIIRAAMSDAGKSYDDLDGIAATAGPGLIGGLIVGLMTAKGIAAATGKPLVAVNHLEGHALTARLTDDLDFPYLLFLVSGGHTQLIFISGVGRYERWGTTIDDALGEAFDKTAKLLGLPYPGGPAVEIAAKGGDPKKFKFPRPLLDRDDLNFSFAGLKTAVRQAAERIAPVTEQDISDICASFQAAVCDVIESRLRDALGKFAASCPETVPAFVAAGGVAANKAIRATLEKVAQEAGARFLAPPIDLCTDNAAMIAWAGAEQLAEGNSDPLSVGPRSRWPLDQNAGAVVGYGRRGAKV